MHNDTSAGSNSYTIEIKCMNCGDPVRQNDNLTYWCSLKCKGYVLESYNIACRYPFNEEENEYWRWLQNFSKDGIPDGSDLLHPNERVREEAKRWLKEK